MYHMIVRGLAAALILGLFHTQSAFAVDLFKGKKDQEASKPAEQSVIVAEVNGTPITREQLAEELISTHGEKQLEFMIHRMVIEEACKQRNITVTDEEVQAEIQDTIDNLNIRLSEFRDSILARRGITYNQYIRDTVRPAIALKKLVEGKVEVTEEDLKKAFLANYGEKVEVRMLVVREQRKAFEFWEQLDKIKEQDKRLQTFEELCKTYSVDQATRPYGGEAVIHRYTGAPEIENLAFGLQEGQLSKIIQVRDGNLMLLCVKRIPQNEEITMETIANEKTQKTVRQMLHDDLFEKKTRIEVAKVFEELSKSTPVKNYLTGDFDVDSLREQKAN